MEADSSIVFGDGEDYRYDCLQNDVETIDLKHVWSSEDPGR